MSFKLSSLSSSRSISELIILLLFCLLILKYSDSSTLPKVRCLPSGQCSCPEDPLTELYPDPDDSTCQHYYMCHLGRAFKKKCDVRQAFHPKKGECMGRQRIQERDCKFPVECPLWINRYMEDPDDCTKYYLCFYQRPSHYSCPDANYFDPEQEKCIHDQYQAEACHKQALLEKGIKLNIQPEMEKSSDALTKARAAHAAHPTVHKIPKEKSETVVQSFVNAFGGAFHG